MEPMLKSTVNGPFDSVQKGNVDSFEGREKKEERTTLKKVDNRNQVN